MTYFIVKSLILGHKKFQKLRICETESANFEEWYRKVQLRICETANIEDCEYRGIPVIITYF